MTPFGRLDHLKLAKIAVLLMKKISLWVVERAGALWGGVEGGFFLHDELMKLGREVVEGGAKSRARRQILVWYLPRIN